MRPRSAAVLFLFLIAAGTLPAAAQGPGLTFRARLTMQLCPEYSRGGVVVELSYTIGESTDPIPATIVAQNIDAARNTGVFELEFPSYYLTNQFHVTATCRNARGYSPQSNVLNVSNCDALALYDTDQDGIPNNQEDTDCSNYYSPGDLSNPENVDTDGDGVRDLVEVVSRTNPSNPGSSPRPFVFSAAPFDPDQNGSSNPVVWRGSTGTWYIKDHQAPGSFLSFKLGALGDVPFTYLPGDALPGDVGVVRQEGTQLRWNFRGPGIKQRGGYQNSVLFGMFGDNILLGPWETPNTTNLAVARLWNGHWAFYVLMSDGSVRSMYWGGNGDLPKPGDYDGDGIYDVAVFRPSEQRSYIIHSHDGSVIIYKFGSGTGDHTVRGDFTGDGVEDISYWEPISGMFATMSSDNGFDDRLAREKDPDHYFETQLGLYSVHLPLNWNVESGRLLYTVVDHATGMRFFRTGDQSYGPVTAVQWGLPGDSQG